VPRNKKEELKKTLDESVKEVITYEKARMSKNGKRQCKKDLPGP